MRPILFTGPGGELIRRQHPCLGLGSRPPTRTVLHGLREACADRLLPWEREVANATWENPRVLDLQRPRRHERRTLRWRKGFEPPVPLAKLVGLSGGTGSAAEAKRAVSKASSILRGPRVLIRFLQRRVTDKPVKSTAARAQGRQATTHRPQILADGLAEAGLEGMGKLEGKVALVTGSGF